MMLFHELKPKTFKDMAALDSSSHNSFSWSSDAGRIDLYHFQQMISSEAFKKYPCFTRDDFFDCLLESGVKRTLAFDASEYIRKGYAACSAGERKQQFDALEIPDEIKEVAGNYLYLFPRAHEIEYMLLYAKIAYYAKIDSRAFSRIIFKGRQ